MSTGSEMPRTEQHEDNDREARRVVARAERSELLDHLQAMLEPLMVGLGLVFLALLLLDFAGPDLSERGQRWLDDAMTAIWIIFLADFVVRLVVAPSKLGFLRANWLGALSLVLPFLRPLRVLRAARAVRSISLVRLLGGMNRGIRVLRRVTGGRQVAFVAALTGFVVLAGAVGARYFDRDTEGATIRTFGDSLWWAAALVTTVNSEKYAVSPEARVVAILMRVYAVSVFGLVTASIASYLIGASAESSGSGDVDALRTEIADLRRELTTVTAALASFSPPARVDDSAKRGRAQDEPAPPRAAGGKHAGD